MFKRLPKRFERVEPFEQFEPFRLLYFPALLRDVDAVTLRIMNAIFRKGDSLGSPCARRDTGLFRPGAHFVVAPYMKTEMVQAQRLFGPPIKQSQIKITIGDKNG